MGVFQHAENTELQFFPWINQHPAKLTSLLNMLEGWRANTPQWFEIFPTKEFLFKGAKENHQDSALLVDVAGGFGADIQTFKDRFLSQTEQLA